MSGIPAREIRGKCRYREIISARHVTWLIEYRAGYSYKYIATYYGRDHSTILHGVHRASKSDAAQKFVALVQKSHPELFEDKPNELKTVAFWNLP